MSKAATLPSKLRRPESSALLFDGPVILPILFCAYSSIVRPLVDRIYMGPLEGGQLTAAQTEILTAPHLDNKIIMASMFAVSVILLLRHWSRLTFPPHIICLVAFLTLAGAIVSWAFKPEVAYFRFSQQAMVVTIILPALLGARTADLMRGVFLCFALVMVVNVFFVLNQSPLISMGRDGYPGYFESKGALGECAAIAVLLAFREVIFPGWRRVLGIIVIGLAIYLIDMSDARGPMTLVLLAPLLARLTLFVGRKIRVSPAITLLSVAVLYVVLSVLVGNLTSRISWYLYGNYTLTGRTIIWDFVNYEIARKPLLGWGYQSFWNVGPDGPSVVDAPGWLKLMPSGHNGYLDTIVDLGYVGLVFLVIFILATVHAIGRVADHDPKRGRFLLSIALYVILTNFIESKWMQGPNRFWLLFLFTALETARYCRYLPPRATFGPVHRPAAKKAFPA